MSKRSTVGGGDELKSGVVGISMCQNMSILGNQ